MKTDLNGKRKSLPALLLAICLLFPLEDASAGIPSTDYANLAQGIYENIMAMLGQEELITYFRQGGTHSTNLTGSTVDGDNNAAANTIARINKAEQDIFNIGITMQDMPSSDSCTDFSSSRDQARIAQDQWCDFLSGAAETQTASSKSIVFDDDDAETAPFYDTSEEYGGNYKQPSVQRSYRHLKNKQVVDRLRERAPSVVDAEATNAEVDFDNTALSARNIMAGDTYTLSAAQYEAAVDLVYLLAPPYESRRAKRTYAPTLSTKELSEASRQNVANIVLNSVISERYAASGQSKLERIMAYADSKFEPYKNQNDTFIETMTTSDVFSPFALLRDIAVLNAFKTKMLVEKYELSLKRELVSATILATRIEP